MGVVELTSELAEDLGDVLLTRSADVTLVVDLESRAVLRRWYDPDRSRLPALADAADGRIEEWVHPDDLPDVMDAILGAIHECGTRITTARIHPYKSAGTDVPLMLSITDIRDECQRSLLLQVWVLDTHHELQEATAGRAEAEGLFRAVFYNSPLATAMVALDGRLVQVNESFALVTGYSIDQLQGMRFQDITHPDDLAADEALLEELLDGRRSSYQMEKRYRHRAGHDIWVELTVSPVLRSDGSIGHLVSHVEDITSRLSLLEEVQSFDDLAYWATHDHLTGLPNRRHLDCYLAQCFEHSRRAEDHLAVLFLDLDDFKPVNDLHGHHIGDEVLRTIARRLRSVCREEALVARFGGDEFVVVSRRLRHATDVQMLVERILSAVSTPIDDLHACTIQIGASVGIGLARAGDDAETLVRRADQAAYRAKADGKNRVSYS